MFLIHAKRHSGVCENAFCSKDSKPYSWNFVFSKQNVGCKALTSWQQLKKQYAGFKALKSWQKLKSCTCCNLFWLHAQGALYGSNTLASASCFVYAAHNLVTGNKTQVIQTTGAVPSGMPCIQSWENWLQQESCHHGTMLGFTMAGNSWQSFWRWTSSARKSSLFDKLEVALSRNCTRKGLEPKLRWLKHYGDFKAQWADIMTFVLTNLKA